MQDEIWKDIQGYEGLYQISNYGNLKSLDHIVKTKNQYNKISNRTVKGKKIKKSFDRDNYYTVSLCKNNNKTTKRIHRLVAQAFIPNLENKSMINHKDENKQNNNFSNLEWCTAKYNTNYNNMPKRRGISKRKKVYQFDKQNNLIKIWNYSKEAAEFYKVKDSSIRGCCCGKTKTIKKFIWKYQR